MGSEKDRNRLKSEIEKINDNIKSIRFSHEEISIDFEGRIKIYNEALEQSIWTEEDMDFLAEKKFNVQRMREREDYNYSEFEHDLTREIALKEEEIHELENDESKEDEQDNSDEDSKEEDEDNE